jgi:hypothetical protein
MSRTSEGRARIEVLVVGSILSVDSAPSVSALDALDGQRAVYLPLYITHIPGVQ